MTRWIVGSSLQFRLLVVAIAAVVMVIGVAKLRNAPMDILPEFNAPYVEIQTEALGLSAAEVEQLVTVPLEADLLNGVAWLKTIRSESMPGLSSVVMTFEPGTDIMMARQVVQERLTQAHALPNVSKVPTMLQPKSSTSRIMNIGLKSDTMSLIDMSVLARWTMKPRLMGVNGVAHVSIWGQRKRELQVHVDPEKLRDNNLTLNQIVDTAGNALWISPLTFLNASFPGTGGFIETPNQRLSVRHVLPISSPEDMGKVAITRGHGLILSDIATVVEDHPPLIGEAIVDDGSGLFLVIEKFPWANTVEVTEGVEAALAQLAPGLGGMTMDTKIFRPATYITTASANLNKAWLIGTVLALAGLMFLLLEWRTALISMIAIPLSMVAAASVLYYREGGFNAMTLAGLMIAIGVIVDDAVSDSRNILRRLRQNSAAGNRESVASVILSASQSTRSIMAFATLILLAVMVPAFSVFGIAGSMVKPVAMSYVLAILASMIVALAVTPALAVYVFKKGAATGGDSPLLRALGGITGGFAAQAVKSPAVAIGALFVLAIGAVALMPAPDREDLVPHFNETDILIRAEAAPGTGPESMTRVITRASSELRSLPGVGNVGAHVGRAVLSEEVVNLSSAELWVSINPTADYQETIDAVQAVVDGYPGLSRLVNTYGGEQVDKALNDDDKDLVVRIYGENLNSARAQAELVRKAISGVDGIIDPQVEEEVTEPIVHVEANLQACEKFGIKPGDIRRASAILVSGISVGMLFEEQKVFDVVVWGKQDIRNSVTDLQDLLIDTPDGGHVRLGEVASIKVGAAPKVIYREGVNRRIDVYAMVGDGDLASATRGVREVLAKMQFPLEIHAELLTSTDEREFANSRTRNLAIASAIAALLLLQAAFGSWRLGVLAFLALPMAISGGVLMIRLTGGDLTMGALIGLMTVLGLAVRQLVMTIHHYQQALRNGAEFGPEMIREASRERSGSILTSTLVTALAVVPFAVMGNIAGLEVLSPMAIVILGGLVTSTLMSVYVVPGIYMQFGQGAAPEWVESVDEEVEGAEGLHYAKG